MAVLGGNANDIKRRARDNAGTMQLVGELAYGAAAVLPKAAGGGMFLAGSAALALAFRLNRVANDPPRNDWRSYPPQLPESLDSGTGYPLNRRGWQRHWTRATLALGYDLSAALICAERLEGLRMSDSADVEEQVRWADLQRSVGRTFAEDAIWRTELMVDELPALVERAFDALNDGDVPAADDDSRGVPRLGVGAVSQLRKSFSMPVDAWTVLVGGPDESLDQWINEVLPTHDQSLDPFAWEEIDLRSALL